MKRLLILSLIVLVVLLLASPLMVLAQEATPEIVTVSPPTVSASELPSQPQADDPGLAALTALAAIVGVVIEGIKDGFLKRLRTKHQWSDDLYLQIVVALSAVLGVGATLIAGEEVDLLRIVGITTLPPLIGIVMSGLLIGLGGSRVINESVGWLKGITAFMRAYELSQRTTTVTINKPQISGATAAVVADMASTLIRESRG